MIQRLRFSDGFALLGLAVTGGLRVYSFSSFHAVMNPVIVLCLCPPRFSPLHLLTFTRPQRKVSLCGYLSPRLTPFCTEEWEP